MLAAKINVMRWAISSPLRRRSAKARAPPDRGERDGAGRRTAMLGVAISLDLGNLAHLDGHDLLGQTRISERLGIVLALGQHPVQELFDNVALHRVSDFHWNQQVSEAADRISTGLCRIGDRNSDVLRHLL